MNKKLLSVAIAAAVAVPLAAQAEIKLSGTIQAEVGNLEISGADGLTTTDDSNGALAGGGPNAVKFDFSEDLGGGLKAVGRIDWAFDTTNQGGSGAANGLSDREKFVGLQGSSGAYFRMGRIQGAYKTATKIDPFYGTAGQMRIGGGESGGEFGHGGYVNNVAELGFSGGGFKVALQGVLSDDGNDATALADDGVASRSGSVLANVEYKNDMFTVYGGYSNDEARVTNGTNWKVGGKVAFGGLGVGLQYEDAENNPAILAPGPGEYISGSLTYGLGSVVLGGWVSQFTGDSAAVADAMSFAAGGLYQFSKKTFVYAAYHSIDRDVSGSDAGDLSGFAAGVRHSF
jgi:predicted porin